MKIATKNLSGCALDWAVIVAEYGAHDPNNPGHLEHFLHLRAGHAMHQQARYSERWDHAGPIIEREKITLECTRPDDVTVFDCNPSGNRWMAGVTTAYTYDGGVLAHTQVGPTPLVAAMRCFVASKLGDEVEIPEGLA